MRSESKEDAFYAKLALLFELSQKHYKLYLENSKTYLYAKSIYRTNEEIVRLIKGHRIDITNKSDHDDFLALLVHYDIWMSQFEILEKQLNPLEETTFMFVRPENTPAFPKVFCDSLAAR